mgnify:CR=1 FL=1
MCQKDHKILYIFCITDAVPGDTYHILPFRRRGLRDGAGSLRFSFYSNSYCIITNYFTPSSSSSFAACFRFSN